MNILSPNLDIGSKIRVYVGHVNHLNDFYLFSSSANSSRLKHGQELCKEYSKSSLKPLSTNENLNVGDYCAFSSQGQHWYRGVIHQLDSNGIATVFNIDYGNEECVSIQFLRPLQKRFFRFQRLVFHCSLANLIKPINGWSLEAIEEFRSRLAGPFLYAKFINYNQIKDIFEVEITEKGSETSLNKEFEQYQLERGMLQMNDKLVYENISTERLDSNKPNPIRLLFYINPSRFYVCLEEKFNFLTTLQNDLQKTLKEVVAISSLSQYQLCVAHDDDSIWYRAIALDPDCCDVPKTWIFLIDFGRVVLIPRERISGLPVNLICIPAFAIACGLNGICPSHGNQQSTWKSNDQVHNVFNRLMNNYVTCQVCSSEDETFYDVTIDIPGIGDLGTYLIGNNLASDVTMGYLGQPPQKSLVQTQPAALIKSSSTQQHDYNNSNDSGEQSVSRATTSSSLTVCTRAIRTEYYTITHIYSVLEFYGRPQYRELEFQDLYVRFISKDILFVIQRAGQYYRVTIKYCESESRVLVKLIDRGDEIIVDRSELLQIDDTFSRIPPFVEPFHLHGYDEPQNSANITLTLKKLILNQPVLITLQTQMMNGFYSVEVTLPDNRPLNQMIPFNNKHLLVTSSISNNTPVFNQPQHTHVTSQAFENFKTNDVLPVPQNILTRSTHTQSGQFGGVKQTSSVASSTNEKPPHFSTITSPYDKENSSSPTSMLRQQQIQMNQQASYMPNVPPPQQSPSCKRHKH